MLKVTFKKIIIMASCCYSHIPKADLGTELSKVFFPDMSSGDCGFMLSLDLTLQSPGLCVHTVFFPSFGRKEILFSFQCFSCHFGWFCADSWLIHLLEKTGLAVAELATKVVGSRSHLSSREASAPGAAECSAKPKPACRCCRAHPHCADFRCLKLYIEGAGLLAVSH